MTTSAQPASEVVHGSELRSVVWLLGTVETAASLTAMYAIAELFSNKLSTMLAFFGETPTVTPGNVSTYNQGLTTLAVAVAVTFVACLWRKRGSSGWLRWHGLVLIAGLFAAAAFHVAIETLDPIAAPTQDPPRSPCYSGGDNSECVGG